MLTGINVTNIALIKKLNLDLSEGLNILSGETGAGKSIIIDSLNFVLGERADKTLIRHGENMAEVEASFYFGENDDIRAALEEIGIECDEGIVIIRRTLNVSGRSDIKVNGHTVTLAMLKTVSGLLCDILGQHEHQSLLKQSTHIDILDNFADNEIQNEKESFAKAYAEYKSICKELSEVGNREARARELDMLEYAIKEIDAAELYDGIEEELASSRNKFQNAERLIEGVTYAESALSNGEGHAAQDCVYRAYNALLNVEKFDNDLSEFVSRLDSVRIELDDIAASLSSVCSSYDFNAERAEEVEQRYEQLKNLKRKYGPTVDDIIAYGESAKQRKEVLIQTESNSDKLEERKMLFEDKLYILAKKLSEIRRETAFNLEKAILSELAELGMSGTLFKVHFDDIPMRDAHMDKINANGFDNVEFLISPNKGEPLRSLSKIISGGEMSRFMLALKSIIASVDGIGTLVFDEIDTGISGKIAHEVARKLYKISKSAQVIAITHLPQIAAVADKNYLIEKKSDKVSTETFVCELSDEDKLKEVSRLAGGVERSANSESHARELIDSFLEFKKSLI